MSPYLTLEGGVTFEVAGQAIPAAGPDGCRMLFILTPGGRFDEMIREMSVPAGARSLPPRPDGPSDVARIAAAARAHGCELLI